LSASISSPTDDQPDIEDIPAAAEDELPRSFLESKLWFAAFGITGVIVAVAAVIFLTRADSVDQGFAYTELVPPREILDFSLTNHRGEKFTLSDHDGETTILTFLYTSCTDVCPFIGAKLRQTLDILGDDAEGVNVVAITLDPERDSPQRAADYSRSLRMFDDWDYLLGETEELLPLWIHYFTGEPIITDRAVFATNEEIEQYGLSAGLTDLNERTANQTRFEFGGGYDVGHATPVIIIDKSLKMRLVAGQSLEPDRFAEDVRRIHTES
jgi:cytochrome oxidase Cu insertion factor (SCO1/SenC/PrrC family)